MSLGGQLTASPAERQSGLAAAHRGRVIALTVIFGLAYTLFSEWLNIEVRESWAYSDLMPVFPIIDAGLSPVLQWIVIPLAGFRFAMASRAGRRTRATADA